MSRVVSAAYSWAKGPRFVFLFSRPSSSLSVSNIFYLRLLLRCFFYLFHSCALIASLLPASSERSIAVTAVGAKLPQFCTFYTAREKKRIIFGGNATILSAVVMWDQLVSTAAARYTCPSCVLRSSPWINDPVSFVILFSCKFILFRFRGTTRSYPHLGLYQVSFISPPFWRPWPNPRCEYLLFLILRLYRWKWLVKDKGTVCTLKWFECLLEKMVHFLFIPVFILYISDVLSWIVYTVNVNGRHFGVRNSFPQWLLSSDVASERNSCEIERFVEENLIKYWIIKMIFLIIELLRNGGRIIF